MRAVKLIKITQSLLVLFFLYFTVFTVSQFGLGLDVGGQINCPLMPGHSMVICQMNPIEHIQEWQTMFTVLPAKEASVLLFILFILLAFRILPWHKQRINTLFQSFSQFRFLPFNNFQIIPPLQEALSKGILNPKLF